MSAQSNTPAQGAGMDWLGLADYLDRLEGDLLSNDADALIADPTPPSVWADRIRTACSVTEGERQTVAGGHVKPIYVKRWRTLVMVSTAYADRVRDILNGPTSHPSTERR